MSHSRLPSCSAIEAASRESPWKWVTGPSNSASCSPEWKMVTSWDRAQRVRSPGHRSRSSPGYLRRPHP